MFSTTVTGRMTRDPRVIETNGEVKGVSFGLADNRRWQDSQGNTVEATTFVDVVCWDAGFAANISASLHKGDFVIVHGDLQANNYESDGVKVNGYTLRARFVGPDLRFQSAPVTRNERSEATSAQPEPAMATTGPEAEAL